MSDYQPKVGDRVMVGEHGPYEAKKSIMGPHLSALFSGATFVGTAPIKWLTPAPEPVPDEPTAPGALVRDGGGRLLARDHDDEWMLLAGPSAIAGDWQKWPDLPRPITVILADPAEVEKLRAERDEALRRERVAQENAESRLQSAMKAGDRADELQRRIDRALGRTLKGTQNYYLTDFIYEQAAILRGES